MKQVTLIFVGGFLGAGKTTLLGQAAARLGNRGRRVGIITNDQADDLVDTGFLREGGFGVSEVAGGCFCCRFDDLVGAAEGLLDRLEPDILLGEPVGSCTDISATVLQPLKELYGDWFRVAPFSVLADPLRLREALDGGGSHFPESVLYIFRKQLEEADLIVLNKTDLLTPDELGVLKAQLKERFPGVRVLPMSAVNGGGVDGWLDAVLAEGTAGARITEVDYDTYADGEAVLGWLNATVQLRSTGDPIQWDACTRRFMLDLWGCFKDLSADVAHLKVLVQTECGSVVANATGLVGEPVLRGEFTEVCGSAAMVVNARVHLGPEKLREVVEAAIGRLSDQGIGADVVHVQSLSPGRPEPKHRYDHVV